MEIEPRRYILIGAGIAILLVSLTVFFISQASNQSPLLPGDELEQCKTLSYNGPGKINLLFFSPKSQASEYMGFLLSSLPFNEHKDSFNFFYIDDYEVDCPLYKGIAILCHSRELVQKATSCPSDYTIVIKDSPERIRSSAFQNVLSINSNHVFMVLLHEMGHAMGNLAEEYVPAKLPRGQPNCKSSCSDFPEGGTDGCFEECSDTSYFRSVKEGAMRTLSPTDTGNPFGTFNSKIMGEEIIKTIEDREPTIDPAGISGQAILDPSSCSNEQYNLVEIVDGQITEITQHTGCASGNSKGTSTYTLTSEGQIIESGTFNPNIYTEVQGSDTIEGEIFTGETTFITTPITGDLIEIFDDTGLTDSRGLDKVGALPCRI
jgi:hypothetical protein